MDEEFRQRVVAFINLSLVLVPNTSDEFDADAQEWEAEAKALLEALGPVWDRNADQDAPCGDCGHKYYRHFDWMEGNAPVGCKYCPCRRWTS